MIGRRIFTSWVPISRSSFASPIWRLIAGTARRNQIAEALAWAAEHREMLALKWIELVERE